jgi:hypothetical protein
MAATATSVSSESKTPMGLLMPDADQFTVESARFILSLTFTQETQDRVHELLDKNSEGQITAAEKEWLEQIVRGELRLATLQSRARLFLKTAGQARS